MLILKILSIASLLSTCGWLKKAFHDPMVMFTKDGRKRYLSCNYGSSPVMSRKTKNDSRADRGHAVDFKPFSSVFRGGEGRGNGGKANR
jgi:hypothetical protein